MKKWGQSIDARRHFRRRSEYEEKKRRRARQRQRGYHSGKTHSRVAVKEDSRSRRIVAPATFSFTDNPGETLNFFRLLEDAIRRGLPAFVDLSQVTTLGPGALLYAVAFLDSLTSRKIGHKIRGNVPKDSKCRRLFESSGFYDFVSDSPAITPSDRTILRVERHSDVDPLLAEKMIEFCEAHGGNPQSIAIKRVFGSLIEFMTNTKEHAYGNKPRGARWYVMAIFDKSRKTARFAFVDTGVGIPATVRKKITEQGLIYLSRMTGLSSVAVPDHELIFSALRGELRSSTGEPWRGKGLPQAKSYFDEGYIDNLIVISRRGFVDVANDRSSALPIKLTGTLVLWDVNLEYSS